VLDRVPSRWLNAPAKPPIFDKVPRYRDIGNLGEAWVGGETFEVPQKGKMK
jgi:hypothetical protein